MEFTKEQLVKKTDDVLSSIETIDKERIKLMEELKSFFPIKEGEKVEIRRDDANGILDSMFIRHAFVNTIKVKLRGKEPHSKARIEFDLQKCKLNGEISQHADRLGPYEYITKIK